MAVGLLREGAIGGILDRLPVLISYTDADGRYQYANSALLRACGKSLDTPAGAHPRDILGEDVFQRGLAQMERVTHGETVTFLDSHTVAGAPRHLEMTFVPDIDAQGKVQGFIGIGYDLTDRVQRETSLATREQRLSSILHTMAEGLVIHDREGRLIEANPAAEQLLSLTRQQLLAWDVKHPHWEAIGEDGVPLTAEELPVIRTLRSGKPMRDQIVGIRNATRQVRWISVNSQPLYDGKSAHPSGVVGTLTDVTALRASVERIRELAQRVETVREQERRELALLLHEGLAQDLFSMRLALGNLRRDWPGSQAQALEELSRVLDRCLADTRQVAGSLRPTGPADRPISDFIREHANYFATLSKLHIRMQASPIPMITDEPTRQLLFRATQEALANVARHAQASCVDVLLEPSGTQIELRITDDGVGLAPDSLDKPGSLGLLGLRERARAVGGILKIERNAKGGTTLVLRLPIAAQTHPA